MPLYEYECTDCGERFEVLQRMGEDGHGLTCPRCGAEGPRRKLSTFATSSEGAGGKTTGGAGAGCGAPSGFT